MEYKRILIIETCFFLLFVLLPMVDIISFRYKDYMEVVDFKEKYEGKIVKYKQPKIGISKVSLSMADIEELMFSPANSQNLTPAVTEVKDGDVVWVSGNIESNDSVLVPIRYRDLDTIMPYKCLNAHYMEMEDDRTREGGFYYHEIYEKDYTVDKAKIGAMPIDTVLLRSHIKPEKCIYEKEWWSDGYKIQVLAIPDTTISCIGRYKDGKLTITAEGEPFIYALKEGVEPEDLINAELERRNPNSEGMTTLACWVLGGILAIVAGLFFTRRKSDRSKLLVADTAVIKELSRLNLRRYTIFAVSLVLPLIALYFWGTIFREYYADESVLILFFWPIFICFSAHTVIEIVLRKKFITIPYKYEILEKILSRNNNVVQSDAPLNGNTLSNLGIIELNGLGVKFLCCEDSFILTIDNGDRKRELNFFEARVFEGDGKEIITLFEALCLTIPVNADKNVRFNIEPISHADNSGLKLRYKKDVKNEAFPEHMKLLTNLSPETEEFLSNTPFLENVQMIKEVMKERLNEIYLVFSVYEGSLYVFAYSDLNRFEISLYQSITYDDVEYDINTVDAFREIGRRWKS